MVVLPPCAQYQRVNKEAGNEWFTIESNKTGTQWTGKVWYVYEMMRYEFDLEVRPRALAVAWQWLESGSSCGVAVPLYGVTCALQPRARTDLPPTAHLVRGAV